MDFLFALFIAVVIGAILQTGVLYSLAIGVDVCLQDIIWKDTIGVTISSRCGLYARQGRVWPAKIVNVIMCDDNHCEEAIANDIKRAQTALALLNTPTKS